jgi:hypothetical protein
MVTQMAEGRLFVLVFQFSAVSIILPTLHIRSFIYNPGYEISPIDKIRYITLKKTTILSPYHSTLCSLY